LLNQKVKQMVIGNIYRVFSPSNKRYLIGRLLSQSTLQDLTNGNRLYSLLGDETPLAEFASVTDYYEHCIVLELAKFTLCEFNRRFATFATFQDSGTSNHSRNGGDCFILNIPYYAKPTAAQLDYLEKQFAAVEVVDMEDEDCGTLYPIFCTL